MLLENKVIIITGAGGGLGEGIARVCHREGARVVIADIRGEAAQEVAASLGERSLAVTCNVAEDAHLQNLAAATLAHFGRIDGLVNNAGVNFVKPFLETTAADWERLISVDLRAVFFLSQLVCRQMLQQTPRGGTIVNISSVHSMLAYPGAGPYDAAKWGVVGLSKAIALEMATQGIRVNVISPGLINTQIWRDLLDAASDAEAVRAHWNANIPMERAIEPEEIGELAAFLLSERSSSMTGANVFADAGLTSSLVSKEPYSIRPIEGE